MPKVVGVSPLHTSVPDEHRAAAGGGACHLVACAAGAAAEQLLASLAHVDPRTAQLLWLGNALPAGPHAPRALLAADGGHLEALLRDRLAHARVGVRLHLAGTDALVRRLTAAGLEAGLHEDEIGFACDRKQLAYRVACVHCHAITEPVETTVADCAGCGRLLLVYHHYSRRKAAYMGFQADAEVRGEIPAARPGVPCP